MSQHGSRQLRDRAQSTTLGVVLLLGIVGVASAGILVLGGAVLSDTQAQANEVRIAQAFRQLDKDIDSVARTDETTRTLDMGLDNENAALRKEEAGRIVVTTSNTSDEIVNRTIGAIVYEVDGTTFAYQAGGVWRVDDSGVTMVSTPDIGYADATLTLPIVSMSGDEELAGDKVTVTKNETPLLTDLRLVKGETVTMKITSEYYLGWAQYFEEQVPNTHVRTFSHNDTVVVEFGRPNISGAFDDGVTAAGDIHFGGGSSQINGNVSTSGEVNDDGSVTGDTDENVEIGLSPIDSVIADKIEWAENNRDNVTIVSSDFNVTDIDGGEVYYFPNGIHYSGSALEADLSTGNVTFIVRGDIWFKNTKLSVDESGAADNEALRVYANGDLSMHNTFWCVQPCDPGDSSDLDAEHNQVYGTSEMQIGMRGGTQSYFEGTIYAPRRSEVIGENTAWTAINGPTNKCKKDSGSDWYDVCIAAGNSGVEGSIIAGSTRLSQSTTVTEDDDLEDVSPVLAVVGGRLPPEITFVHVAVYDVKISDTSEES